MSNGNKNLAACFINGDVNNSLVQFTTHHSLLMTHLLISVRRARLQPDFPAQPRVCERRVGPSARSSAALHPERAFGVRDNLAARRRFRTRRRNMRRVAVSPFQWFLDPPPT